VKRLALTIIGGVGMLAGLTIGAAIVALLGYWLERWFGSTGTLIYGIIFMLIVIFLPYGIVGTIRARSFQWKAGWKRWIRLLSPGDNQAGGNRISIKAPVLQAIPIRRSQMALAPPERESRFL